MHNRKQTEPAYAMLSRCGQNWRPHENAPVPSRV